MLKDYELDTLEFWVKDELENGNRTKASRIFKVLKKHFLKKHSGESESSLIKRINRL